MKTNSVMSKTYYMDLCPTPFSLIKKGLKVVEMRLYKGDRKEIKSDDIIVFTNEENGEKLKVKVLSVSRFPSFKELYENYDKSMLGYQENEIASYKDMNLYYSDEDILKYGTLAIHIKLLKN